MALYSARTGIPVQKNAAFIGELSLAGEIRPVKRLKPRIKTAQSMGFTKVFSPAPSENDGSDPDLQSTVTTDNLSSAIKAAFAAP